MFLLSSSVLCWLCWLCCCIAVSAGAGAAGSVSDSVSEGVAALHAALSPEQLDLPAAARLLALLPAPTPSLTPSLAPADLLAPIYGDRPLLHHALNLYFMRKSVQDRAALVRLMLTLVDKRVEINAPYRNDPDVVFKAVVIRELGLAYALAGGGGLTNNSMSLTQLYSVPCDPVPLSKLLLHAQSVVQAQSEQAALVGQAITVEHVEALLAGASLGAGAKAAARAADLSTHSQSFRTLMEQMLPGDGKDDSDTREGFSLQGIINSLGELGSAVHKQLLQNFLAASDDTVTGLGHLANLLATFDKKGRNPLHTLALSGSSSLARDLVDIFSALDKHKSKRGRRVRGKLAVALTATDIRGHSPVAYAALRYGPQADIYLALRELATLARADLNEVVLEFMFASHTRHEPSGFKEEHTQEDDDTGGWSASVLDEGLRGDPNRCDILEVWTGQPEPVDFFLNYVALGKPVVFRGAMQKEEKNGHPSLRSTLSKNNFLQKYGRENIPVSTIPYASTFGVGAQAMSLQDVAEMDLANATHQQSVEVTQEQENLNAVEEDIFDADQVPLYAFSVASPGWRRQIEDDVGLPSLLEGGGLVQDVEMQFYLGQRGTGAPMHYHGHAVNSLAYGEKQWFLLPPTEAKYSKTPSLQYVKSLRESERSATDSQLPLQCTQRSGDLMYVPTLWGHATLNTKQCIGVAHEFSVDDICME